MSRMSGRHSIGWSMPGGGALRPAPDAPHVRQSASKEGALITRAGNRVTGRVEHVAVYAQWVTDVLTRKAVHLLHDAIGRNGLPHRGDAKLEAWRACPSCWGFRRNLESI